MDSHFITRPLSICQMNRMMVGQIGRYAIHGGWASQL